MQTIASATSSAVKGLQKRNRKELVRAVLRRAGVYAYYTARPRWLNPLAYGRRIAEMRAERKVRSAYPHLLPVIAALSLTGTTGYSWVDYLALYEWIREHRPRWLLECGSGISTGIIAQALTDNGSGQVVSMEESSHYADGVRSRLPRQLSASVTLVHSATSVRAYGKHHGVCYEAVPERPYEFVFIDGPVARQADGGYKCFNSDFLNVVARASGPVAALLDQRIATLWALRELLPGADIRYYPTRRLARFVASPANISPDIRKQLHGP